MKLIWNFLVLRAVFVWLMWCSVIFLLSEPYFQVSHLVIKWWAKWACWFWVEWYHSRKKFSLHERSWPMKLTQWNRPSVANLHHTSLKKSLLKSILHVFKALQNRNARCCCSSLEGTCLFWVARSTSVSYMRSFPQSSTGRYMLLLLLRRHLFVLRGKKHFSQLFSYTALHNPLLLLPTPHCNYLTESEGMSRWSVKILPQALLRYLGAREAETFSSIHCHAQASDMWRR